MPRDFTSDEWREILALAREASALPKLDRRAFLQSQSSDGDVIAEALQLAGEFDLQPDEPLGRADTTIGRFRLIEHLGSGGSGDVYTADDPELRRKVAIKIFRVDMASESAEHRFIREARAASALSHPNIVTVYEIVRSDTRIAIVMELVPGSPLRELCGSEVKAETLYSIGLQAADALAAAHAAGIVHRDIKPENIMRLPDGRVKVLDFGLARQAIEPGSASILTMPGAIPGGTLRYMSPEHFRTQPIKAESDIFALGLVLCELASGKHPFNQRPADSPLDILHAIANHELPANLIPSGRFPARFESLIRTMLAKEARERPTASAVVAALKELSGQRPTEPTGERRVAKWAAVATGLLVVSLIAGFFITRRETIRNQFTSQLQITKLVPENRATAAAISRDGQLLAYANVDGVFVQALKSEETTLLQGPPDFVVDYLAWAADGLNVIASGFSSETNQPAIWSVPLNGRHSRELRAGARYGVPSPDGRRLAFISGDFSSIGIMDPDGQDAKIILQVAPGDSLHLLVWSFDGRHLVMQKRHLNPAQEGAAPSFHWSLEAFDPASKTVTASRPNWPDEAVPCVAALSPDAIAFIGSGEAPPRARTGLWSIRLDPETGQLGSPARQIADPLLLRDQGASALSLSDDGSKAVVLRSHLADGIFVADFNRPALHLSRLQHLSLSDSASYPHSWTSDSQQVIFESNRGASTDLFRQHLNKHLPEPVLLTPQRGEFLPQMSPDGQHIIFASSSKSQRALTLMRIAFGGGAIEEVPTDGPLDEFRCSTGDKGRCVLRKTVEQSEFVYYDLDPVRGIGQELSRVKWQAPVLGDWDVSPDGQFVAIPVHDARSARIRVVRLNSRPGETKEREVVLPGLTQLAIVSYAADGTGWFAGIQTTVGRRMYFADLQGRVTSLGDISGWAVPAPDGKKVAFMHQAVTANAWILTDK